MMSKQRYALPPNSINSSFEVYDNLDVFNELTSIVLSSAIDILFVSSLLFTHLTLSRIAAKVVSPIYMPEIPFTGFMLNVPSPCVIYLEFIAGRFVPFQMNA